MNKKTKNIMQLLWKIAFSIGVFFASAIIATEVLQKKIYFSLFAGIPFGFIMGVIALLIVFKYPSQTWNVLNITFKNLFAFLIGGTISATVTLIFLMQYLVSKTAPGEGLGLVIGAIIMFFFWLIVSALTGGCLGIIIYNLIKHFRNNKLRIK